MTDVETILEENKKLKSDLSLLQEFVRAKEKKVGEEIITQTDYEVRIEKKKKILKIFPKEDGMNFLLKK